jgi:hypothetical protein
VWSFETTARVDACDHASLERFVVARGVPLLAFFCVVVVFSTARVFFIFRPELRQEHPLNLSISISGGKETNEDSPSNGERTGKSPT